MKRRTALFGLGVLASGSGAIATSAAVANSVQTASKLSIVVDERIEVRAGQAFNDDGSIKNKSKYTSRYVPYDTNSSFFDEQNDVLADIERENLPVATVNSRDKNVNGNVKIQTAIPLDIGTNTFLFEDILELENYGGSKQSVGISYDRSDTTYGPNGQYGEDVNVGDTASDNKLTAHDVRAVFSFQVPERFRTNNSSPQKISPAEINNQGDNDDPESTYDITSGQTVQLNLRVDFSTYGNFVSFDPRKGIESGINKSPSFSGTVDTVDLLDAITVKTS